MSSLDNHVSMVVTADSVGVARAGFGMPLVLSPNAPRPERVRVYQRLADVISDGFAANTPEALAVGAMFGQSPHARRVAIGRAANRPTQRYSVGVAAVRNLFPYQLRVSGPGFGPVTQQFVSGAAATDAQIHCVQRYGNLLKAVEDLRTRYEDIVIDAGGRDSEELALRDGACR